MSVRPGSGTLVRHRYIPLSRVYKSNRRLSERIVRQRLERAGWTVWRGGALAIHRDECYPNVHRKYSILDELLGEKLELLQLFCAVHHGMPDYFCHRKGEFKFVECKLGHEQLSRLQKRCIARLKAEGFTVEVHKLVFPETKLREADVDIDTHAKSVRDRQLRLGAIKKSK